MFTETEGRNVHSESSLSQLPSLFKRFVDQLLRLFDTQLALFKTELRGVVKIYTKQLILTTASVIVASAGFVFLSIGLVFWVNGHINNLAISFGCVGGTYLIIGTISVLAAVRRMTKQIPVLNQTLEELEKDQKWIKTEIDQAK